MTQETLQVRALRTNSKVQALLQQLIAHRGEPSAQASLSGHAHQTMTELFALTVEAQKSGEYASLVEEAKETLLRHFPQLLENKEEAWENH